MMRAGKITILLAAAICLVSVLSGCERHIDSQLPVRSLPEPPARPYGLQAVINNQSLGLSWSVADATGIIRYRVYKASAEDGVFSIVDSSTQTSITITGLTAGADYLFEVASVTDGGVEGYRSEPLAVRFGVTGISLNSNQKYTSDRSVTVQLLSDIQATHVALSEDPNLADSVFLPYAGQVSFELSAGDGPKTVYARFSFRDGSRSGDPVSDDIILDTRAAISSVIFLPQEDVFIPGDTIRFYVDVGEPDGAAEVSFGSVTRMKLYNDGQGPDVVAGDNIFTGWYVVPEDVNLTDGTVTATFRDEAGNPEVSMNATQRLSLRSSLLPVDLVLVEPKSSFEMNLLWTQAAVAEFNSYRVYRGTGSAVTSDSVLVATITSRSQTSLTDTALNDNTQYTYVVYLRDQLARDTASNVMSGTTEANQPPQAVTLAASLDSDGSTALLTWSRNQDADFESYRIFRSNNSSVTEADQMVGYVSSRTSTSISDYIPSGVATAWYRVYVYDRHGASTGSNTVSVTK